MLVTVAFRFMRLNIKFHAYYKMQGDTTINQILLLSILITFLLVARFAEVAQECYFIH